MGMLQGALSFTRNQLFDFLFTHYLVLAADEILEAEFLDTSLLFTACLVPHEKILTKLGDHTVNDVSLCVLMADGLRLQPAN
jgi:hypothetical protein